MESGEWAYQYGRPCVYIIRFDAPLGNERKQSRHYCGWVSSRFGLERRLHQHRTGGVHAAAICRAAAARGIGFTLAWWGYGSRQLERTIKNQGVGRWLARQERKKARELRRVAQTLMYLADIDDDAIPF